MSTASFEKCRAVISEYLAHCSSHPIHFQSNFWIFYADSLNIFPRTIDNHSGLLGFSAADTIGSGVFVRSYDM